MRRHATSFLVPALALGAALAPASGCAPDVVGGTRDVQDDCVCDCELGCGPEGPERPDAEAATAQGAGGGDAAAVTGAGGGSSTAEGGAGGQVGAGGDEGAGGAGGRSIDGCGGGSDHVGVTIDGDDVATCDVEASLGALNHVTARFTDGHTLIVSFSGQEPADDVCVGIALRAPGNDTSENDWQVGDTCEVSISAVEPWLEGTFSATLQPVSDVELGPRVLSGGELLLLAP